MAGVTVSVRGAAPRLAAPAVAAVLSLLAAWVHFAYAASHLRQWWAYGAFFIAAGGGQALCAPLVLRRPGPLVAAVGIAGNLAIVGMYVLTRTAGAPLGPHAHVPDAAGATALATRRPSSSPSSASCWPSSAPGRAASPRTSSSSAGPCCGPCGSAAT